ncbi:MAG: hypothetical protein AAFY71_03690 [Bacteroidota bacterium]
MKQITGLIFTSFAILFLCFSCQKAPFPAIPEVPQHVLDKDIKIDKLIQKSLERLHLLTQSTSDSSLVPRGWDTENQKLILDKAHVWTSGFYPASLWMAYDLSQDSSWEEQARRYTYTLAEQIYAYQTHDLGFMIYNSLGKGYALTGDSTLRMLCLMAADELMKLFDVNKKAIKTAPRAKENGLNFIIDNLINLELLHFAYEEGGETRFQEAIQHHLTFCLNEFLKKDHSNATYVVHQLSFEEGQEEPIVLAGQGAGQYSKWSRGQAWGIYGFSQRYLAVRESPDTTLLSKEIAQKCLHAAKALADQWILNAPSDGIPYWDFEAQMIPHEPKDASAACVAACGMLMLYESLPPEEGKRYYSYAENIIKALSSDIYFLQTTEIPFILNHSTLSVPHEIDIDGPQTMADYYWLEALWRYKNMEMKEEVKPHIP